jgi:hypothetical protein
VSRPEGDDLAKHRRNVYEDRGTIANALKSWGKVI